MFTNFFGRVKDPCDDCVNGKCTMNCSGKEPAGPSGDKGALIVTHEKDDTMTVRVRSPDAYGESKINIPRKTWEEITDCRCLMCLAEGDNSPHVRRIRDDVGKPPHD